MRNPHYCGKTAIPWVVPEISNGCFPSRHLQVFRVSEMSELLVCCGVFQSWDFTTTEATWFSIEEDAWEAPICVVLKDLGDFEGGSNGQHLLETSRFFFGSGYMYMMYTYIYVRLGEVEDVLHISFWNWRGINVMPPVRSLKPQKLDVFFCMLLHFAR